MKKQNLLRTLKLTSGLLLSTGITHAQVASEIDVTFGASGYVFTDHEINTGEMLHSILALSDDKIITVGHTYAANEDILIAKYDADGALDNTFGNNGKLLIDLSIGGDDRAYAVRELFDGKLLIAGYTQTMIGADGFVTRLNSDGSIDNSFGTNGTVLLNGGLNEVTILRDIHVKADNSIFVAGTTVNFNGDPDFSVFKLTQGGGQDISYSNNGVSLIDNAGENDILESMTVATDGTIYLVGNTGNFGMVTRLAVAGNPFPSFGTSGLLIYDALMPTQILLDCTETSDNKIIVVGFEGSGNGHDGILLKINSDGTFDNSFSGDGKQISDIGIDNGVYLSNVEIVEGGRILATGAVDGLTMQGGYAIMMNLSGSPSFEFAPGGDAIYTMPIATDTYMPRALSIQSDGKILLGGYITSQDFVGENMFLFRIHPVNTASLTELGNTNVKVYPNPASESFLITGAEEIESVQLFDLSGKVVQEWNGDEGAFVLNPEIQTGSYFLNIREAGSVRQIQLQVF